MPLHIPFRLFLLFICFSLLPRLPSVCSFPATSVICSAPYFTCGSAPTRHGNNFSAHLPFPCYPRYSSIDFSKSSILSIPQSTLVFMANIFSSCQLLLSLYRMPSGLSILPQSSIFPSLSQIFFFTFLPAVP